MTVEEAEHVNIQCDRLNLLIEQIENKRISIPQIVISLNSIVKDLNISKFKKACTKTPQIL